MSQYPSPLPLPTSILEKRQERKLEILSAARIGLSLRFAIVAIEFAAFFFFSSASILLDAISSLMDVFSTLLLMFFVRLAEKPPDKNHPFGHGRFEPIAGLLLSFLLAVLGVFLGFHQVQNLALEGFKVAPVDTRAWIVPCFALLILEAAYYIVRRAAKKHRSPALEADAVHYRIDAVTSLIATVALLTALVAPSWSHGIDHFGALLIAFVMVALGLAAAYKNIAELVDRKPLPEYFQLVREAAEGVEGVKGTEKIGIQMSGPDAHVDIDVEVDPELSVLVAHQISQRVRLAIQEKWPSVRDVIVHIEPFYPNDHEDKWGIQDV